MRKAIVQNPNNAIHEAVSPERSACRVPSRCLTMLAVVVVVGMALGLAPGFVTSPASADPCSNAEFRTGYAAYLPDCRAYELVSPPGMEPYVASVYDGSTGNITDPHERKAGTAFGEASAAEGNAIAFFSPFNAPPGSASAGPFYLATRGASGWSTTDLVPPQSTTNGAACFNAYPAGYAENDLSEMVFADGWDQLNINQNCGTDDPPLVSGEPSGFQNVFRRDSSGGANQLINLTPATVSPSDAWFQAGSTKKLDKVVFDEEAQLTSNDPPGDNLYIWSGEEVRLVTVLPNGAKAEGTLANGYEHCTTCPDGGAETFTHAVSEDGSRVFFMANGNLYVRENAVESQSPLNTEGRCIDPTKACSVQVDASQAGGNGGGGIFMWASSDGSKVFFTDDESARLTVDTVEGSGQNLYEYDLNTGRVKDLTPFPAANVQGVSGASADGSHIYFIAQGVLAANANSDGDRAQSGMPNLYLEKSGAVTFIATLDATNDTLDWSPPVAGFSRFSVLTSRVASDGGFIVFNSLRSLTSYDNIDTNTGQPDQEIFVYDAARDTLVCASCAQSGAPPTAAANIRPPISVGFLNGTNLPERLQGFLADNGTVFFDTAEPLVARASNGETNVYEWEPDGVGECIQMRGCVSLISSGTSSEPAYFYDASKNGDDVFFVSSQSLVPEASPVIMNIYDARSDGGFASKGGESSCNGSACREAVGEGPTMLTGATSGFYGLGNVLRRAPKIAVALSKTVVKGKVTAFITVPRGGHLTVRGANVKTVQRSFVRAGRYRIALVLTANGRKAVNRKHRLKLTLRVKYTSSSGEVFAVSTDATVKGGAGS